MKGEILNDNEDHNFERLINEIDNLVEIYIKVMQEREKNSNLEGNYLEKYNELCEQVEIERSKTKDHMKMLDDQRCELEEFAEIMSKKNKELEEDLRKTGEEEQRLRQTFNEFNQ